LSAAPTPALALTLRNTREEIARLAAAVEALGARAGLSSLTVQRLNLVLEEILANTLAYGYPDNGEHALRVGVAVVADGIELEIRDDARPFDPLADRPAPYLGPDLSRRRPGGLGLHLVRQFVREGRYETAAGSNRLIIKMDMEIGKGVSRPAPPAGATEGGD
jgi:anti-sigma regulatory factor (Ser/Thr protein kinase)